MKRTEAANWPRSRSTTKSPMRLFRGFHEASMISHTQASRSVIASSAKHSWLNKARAILTVPLTHTP